MKLLNKCNSKNVIYCIHCSKCGSQYVGKTNNIRLRMNNHKSAYRMFRQHGAQTECYVLYQHLWDCSNLDGNTQVPFSFQILDKGNCESVLAHKEKQWIWKLNTVTPNGLNIDDGFAAQNKKPRSRRY